MQEAALSGLGEVNSSRQTGEERQNSKHHQTGTEFATVPSHIRWPGLNQAPNSKRALVVDREFQEKPLLLVLGAERGPSDAQEEHEPPGYFVFLSQVSPSPRQSRVTGAYSPEGAKPPLPWRTMISRVRGTPAAFFALDHPPLGCRHRQSCRKYAA